MNAYPVEYVFRSLPQDTYADESTCQRDVTDCINAHPTLYPEVAQVKMDNNNASERLVVLKGTIPVVYNHTQYHFPVEICLPVYYPHESPLFKVTPTAELKILPGHRHVDSEGRVYHPYISNWGVGQQQQPNLREMVRQVAHEFSKAPPLYSPPKYAPPPPPVYSNAVPPPPVYRAPPSLPPPPPPPVYRAPPLVPPTNVSTSQLAAAGHAKLFRTRCVDKIRFRLETALPKMQKEFQSELEVSEKLQNNSNLIDSQLDETQQCEKQMEAQLLQLHQAQVALQEQIVRQKQQREEHSVEESVGFPFDNVAFHLFQSVVDSLALEDVLYHLNNKLQRREVDLKTFLKLSRALSREHFFKSALALKLNQQQQQASTRRG